MNRPDYIITVEGAIPLADLVKMFRAQGIELRATQDGGYIAQPTPDRQGGVNDSPTTTN